MIIHVARLWEKYLSKCGLIKHTCSWPDKLFVLWIKIVKIYIVYKCYLACYFPIIFSYINLWCPVSHICDNSNRSQSWVEIKSLNFRGFKVLIKFYPCHLNKSPTIYYKLLAFICPGSHTWDGSKNHLPVMLWHFFAIMKYILHKDHSFKIPSEFHYFLVERYFIKLVTTPY